MNKDKENTQFLGECTCGEIYTKRNLVAPDCVKCNYEEEVLSAMEQQAVAFAKYIDKNYYSTGETQDRWVKITNLDEIDFSKNISIQEVYNEFNQQN